MLSTNTANENEHEHEWVVTDDSPQIEDGAAIITERCNHVEITGSAVSEKHDEIFHGEGEECGETRHTRFEETKLTVKRDEKDNLTYALNPNANPAERGCARLRPALVTVANNGTVTAMNPCKQTGEVIVETDKYKVTYKPVSELP